MKLKLLACSVLFAYPMLAQAPPDYPGAFTPVQSKKKPKASDPAAQGEVVDVAVVSEENRKTFSIRFRGFGARYGDIGDPKVSAESWNDWYAGASAVSGRSVQGALEAPEEALGGGVRAEFWMSRNLAVTLGADYFKSDSDSEISLSSTSIRDRQSYEVKALPVSLGVLVSTGGATAAYARAAGSYYFANGSSNGAEGSARRFGIDAGLGLQVGSGSIGFFVEGAYRKATFENLEDSGTALLAWDDSISLTQSNRVVYRATVTEIGVAPYRFSTNVRNAKIDLSRIEVSAGLVLSF